MLLNGIQKKLLETLCKTSSMPTVTLWMGLKHRLRKANKDIKLQFRERLGMITGICCIRVVPARPRMQEQPEDLAKAQKLPLLFALGILGQKKLFTKPKAKKSH